MAVDSIAVLGGGNAGRTIAADMTLKGLEVHLFELPGFAESFAPVMEAGTIELQGVSRQGTARPALITHDVAEAVEGVDLIIVSVPAFGIAPMTELLAPHLGDGDVVFFMPGGLASVVARRVLERTGISADVVLGEMCTLPYGCRITGPTEVTVFISATRLPTAALPAAETPRVVEMVGALYDVIEPAEDVLDTALKNINPCIHPAPTILNAGRIEYADDFYLYGEGMTPSTRRAMVAIDRERQRVREAWGYSPPHYGLDPTPGVYEVFEHYFGRGGLDSAGVKMRGPLDLADRYVTEDVPYGLVLYASAGDAAGVETPITDAVIALAGLMNAEDYFETGLTFETLGLEGRSPEDVRRSLRDG